MIALLPLAMMLSDTAKAVPAPGSEPTAARTPSPESLTVARSIIVKMRVEEQQRVALQKVAPLFALAVLNLPPDKMPPEVNAALQAPDGRLRVAKILNEEYLAAFEVRLPQLTASIVARLATDVPLADLKSIAAFLDTPAGLKWGAEMTSLQQAASEAGRKAGEAAGAAAAVAALQRLRGNGTGS